MIKWLKKSSPKMEESDDLNMFERLRRNLSKTRNHLGLGVKKLLLGKKTIDDALLEDLEEMLLEADLGINATQNLLCQLKEDVAHLDSDDDNVIMQALRKRMQANLTFTKDLQTSSSSPLVILMVGVNGAGKTTTIGKLANMYQQQGKKVMLAAGDTFRAAAVEQLRVWGERNDVSVIAQHTGADSASVIFDAFTAAKARNMDVLIADTAGRLHTQNHLMEELKKIKRVLQKIDPAAPHEIILVLDASIGQNALNQARQFHQAMNVTGIILTKLDGTAKGGIVFAIAHELSIPFMYLGIGEGLNDLREFDAAQFVEAIFEDDPM